MLTASSRVLAQASVAEQQGVKRDVRLAQGHAGAAVLDGAELDRDELSLQVREQLGIHEQLVRAVKEGPGEEGKEAGAAVLAPRACSTCSRRR